MTSKLSGQRLSQLVKTVIFPDNELVRRQKLVFGNDYPKKMRVVIEFSSPNIAKPFHYGHLKSTIFGNYLANLHSYLGMDVIRLNYVGDWGTQFGLLGLQLEQVGWDPKKLADQPLILSLVQNYIHANERAENEDSFRESAKEYFNSLENDLLNDNKSSSKVNQWSLIKSISMDELYQSYDKLGINFDFFDYESQYCQASKKLIDHLMNESIANRLDNGAVIIRLKNLRGNVTEIPIEKSDGCSLYLGRDMAAALDRKDRFKFDRMLYVVGKEQASHFHGLEQIYKLITNDGDKLIHVKTGNVKGMSTRTGQFLLLSNLIEEAKIVYKEKGLNTATSRIFNLNSDQPEDVTNCIAQQLSLSAFFIYDLHFKRMRDYEFDWNSILFEGNASGLNFQATHARLCSLITRVKNEFDLDIVHDFEEFNINAIDNIESIDLLNYIYDFDEILRQSYENLESYLLIDYTIQLCKKINKARQAPYLRVLNEAKNDEINARAKLTLFVKARNHLAIILKLLGLKPLERI